MSFRFLVTFFILFEAQLLSSVYSDYVPVYLWEESNEFPMEQTLGRVSEGTFKEMINSRTNENIPIVVFAEKKLSPEDFVKSPEVFSHLGDLNKNSQVTYLPLVENSISVLMSLKDVVKISINKLTDTSIFPKLRPNQIVIVELDDAKENENRPEMLKRHDEIINKIYNELLKVYGKLTAIYTGSSASWITSEQVINHRQVREILEVKESNKSIFFNVSHFVVNFGAEAFFTKENKTLSFKTEPTTDYKNGSLTITFDNDLVMDFNIVAGYWYLTSVSLDKNHFTVRNIAAPTSFSYHCSTLELKLIKEKNEEEDQYLIFKELQFQPFEDDNITITKFSDAYDCVGFTTIPIWSGLFVTFILAIIMTMGLTMIMDIKTMDRFDDPKGKTIIINATE